MFLSLCRAEDVVCRHGGEEFVILVPGASPRNAKALGERIRAGVERMVRRVTVSVGVATYPACGDHWEALLARADALVYAAKRQGRNRVAGPDEAE